jgi:hypothetical protein
MDTPKSFRVARWAFTIYSYTSRRLILTVIFSSTSVMCKTAPKTSCVGIFSRTLWQLFRYVHTEEPDLADVLCLLTDIQPMNPAPSEPLSICESTTKSFVQQDMSSPQATVALPKAWETWPP